MISFQRSQLVGREFIDEKTIRFNGIQEDHIYGMEISLEVRIDDGRNNQDQRHHETLYQFCLPPGRAGPSVGRRDILTGRGLG